MCWMCTMVKKKEHELTQLNPESPARGPVQLQAGVLVLSGVSLQFGQSSVNPKLSTRLHGVIFVVVSVKWQRRRRQRAATFYHVGRLLSESTNAMTKQQLFAAASSPPHWLEIINRSWERPLVFMSRLFKKKKETRTWSFCSRQYLSKSEDVPFVKLNVELKQI